jgi:hypothetical protein
MIQEALKNDSTFLRVSCGDNEESAVAELTTDYYLVQYAKSIGKTTAQLTFWDLIQFCRTSYLKVEAVRGEISPVLSTEVF